MLSKKELTKTKKESRTTPVPFSWRTELYRQSLHLVLGLFLAGILFFTNIYFFRQLALIMLGVGAVLAWVAKAKKVPALNRLLEKVERRNENIPGQSAFLFVIGSLIPAIIFPIKLVVLAGIISYTFQDSFSTLFGVRWGKTKLIGKKSLEGSLGGWIAASIALCFILPFPQAVLVAAVATIVELLPLNDAWTVPLLSSALVYFWS